MTSSPLSNSKSVPVTKILRILNNLFKIGLPDVDHVGIHMTKAVHYLFYKQTEKATTVQEVICITMVAETTQKDRLK